MVWNSRQKGMKKKRLCRTSVRFNLVKCQKLAQNKLALAAQRKAWKEKQREFHLTCYEQEMVLLWKCANPAQRTELARIFGQATGKDLQQVVESHVIEHLKRKCQ